MNFSDDFEENLSIIIKWLMIASLTVILIWGVANLFKLIFVKREPAKTPINVEVINKNTQIKNAEEIKNELQDVDKDVVDLIENSSSGSTRVNVAGNKVLKLNIQELPDDLYYGLQSSAKELQKKQAAVNKRVGLNYIDSVLSYGSIERWNPASFPLKVFIERPSEVPHNHINEIKSAFLKWQERTNDFISFVFVNSEAQADIVCFYPNDFVRTCDSSKSSETSRQYFVYDNDGHIKKAKIELTYFDCNGQKYADDLVYAFALKEIGRALGLRGQAEAFQGKALFSTDIKSIVGRPKIHTADINTLKLVYSITPDKTNSDFTNEQLKDLIKPDEIWGDKVERTPSSEKAILYNIEKTPDVPALHIGLANYYSEKGQFDKALEVYSKSILLINEAEMKARVYVRVGDTFSLQHRYSEAAEAYKISLKNLNKKQNLFDVYFNLGYIYCKQNKFKESLSSYQSAIQYAYSKEAFYKLLVNLSFVYLQLDNLEDAQKCIEKAISIQKTFQSRYLLAYVKYLRGEVDSAKGLLEEIIKNEDLPMAYGLLAQIYYKNKQYEALQKLYDNAKEVFSGEVPFTFK